MTTWGKFSPHKAFPPIYEKTGAVMHGYTWTTTVDGFLDELIRRDLERQATLDALARLCRRRPELEDDPDMTLARMAVLR